MKTLCFYSSLLNKTWQFNNIKAFRCDHFFVIIGKENVRKGINKLYTEGKSIFSTLTNLNPEFGRAYLGFNATLALLDHNWEFEIFIN